MFDGKYPVDSGLGRASLDRLRSMGAGHGLETVWPTAFLGGCRGSPTRLSSSKAVAAASRRTSCSLTMPQRRDSTNELERDGVGDGPFCAWYVLVKSWLEQRVSGSGDVVIGRLHVGAATCGTQT